MVCADDLYFKSARARVDFTGVAGLLVAGPAELHLCLQTHNELIAVSCVERPRYRENNLITDHLELGGDILRDV